MKEQVRRSFSLLLALLLCLSLFPVSVFAENVADEAPVEEAAVPEAADGASDDEIVEEEAGDPTPEGDGMRGEAADAAQVAEDEAAGLPAANRDGEDNLIVEHCWEWQTIEVNAGEAAVMTVNARTAVGEPTFVWEESDYTTGECAVLEESGSTLTVSPAKTLSYTCTVSDIYGDQKEVYFSVYVSSNLNAWATGDELVKTVESGGDVTLSVEARSDGGGCSYAWYRVSDDGSDVSLGETGSSLLLQNVTAPGEYRCAVKDVYNNAVCVSFSIVLENGFSAYVKGEDSSVTYKTMPVAKNADALLEVAATARSGEIHYQWYYRMVDEDNVYTYVPIDSAVGSSYTAGGVSAPSVYYCRVNDDFGNSNDIWFDLVIDTGLTAREEQSFFSVAFGDSVTMKVIASANDGEAIHYEWARMTIDKNGVITDTVIPQATGSSYVVDSVSASADYRCTVTDDYGNSVLCYFQVRLENHLQAFAAGTTANNATVSVAKNGSAVLRVEASADRGEIHYQWVKEWSDPVDQTGSSLNIQNVTAPQSYTCFVTDDYGNSVNVSFRVLLENHFRAVAAGTDSINAYLSVKPNADVSMKVDASVDTGGLYYQWMDEYWQEIAGKTQAALTVSGVQRSIPYYCRVWDDFGNQEVISFYLNVDNGFYAYARGTKATGATVTAVYGTSAVLAVDAHADVGSLHYVWWDTNGAVKLDETGPELTIGRVERAGQYTCYVSDDYGGSDSVFFRLEVQNHLTAYPKGYPDRRSVSVGVTPGGSTVLEVVADSDDHQLQYQWYRMGSGPMAESSLIEGETGSSLTLSGVAERQSYRCFVSDRYGNTIEVSFSVYVENHLTAWCRNTGTEIEMVLVEYGKPAVLEAVVTADLGPISYEWRDNYGMTALADGPSLTVDAVTGRRQYWCYISDAYGNTRNLEFRVGVQNSLTVTAATPTEQYVTAGASVTFGVNAEASSGPLTYIWYGNSYEDLQKNVPTVTVNNVQRPGIYTCEVTDKYGNSQSVRFTVGIENHFQAYVTGKTPGVNYADVFVDAGANTTLSVTATADQGGFTYSWFRISFSSDGNTYSRGEPAGDTASVTVENVRSAWQYQCLVTDAFGTSRQVTFRVSVQNHLTVADRETKRTAVARTVDYGKPVTLSVDAAADQTDGMRLQWFLQQDGMTNEVLNANGSSLTTPALTESCTYICQATDCYGYSAVVRYMLTVTDPDQPAAVTVDPALNLQDTIGIKFYVKPAEGTDPKNLTVSVSYASRYQTINRSYRLADMTPSKGEYLIRALDAASDEMSDVVVLTVKNDGRPIFSQEYSIAAVANSWLANERYESVWPLLRAMLQYGDKAQGFFGNHPEMHITPAGAPRLNAIPPSFAPGADPATLKEYLAYVEFGVNLEAAVGMNIYIKPKDGIGLSDVTVKVTNRTTGAACPTTAPALVKGEIKVTVPGLFPEELLSDLNITVTVKGVSATYVRSVMSCAYSLQQKGTAVDLVKALYQYSLAAKDYFT